MESSLPRREILARGGPTYEPQPGIVVVAPTVDTSTPSGEAFKVSGTYDVVSSATESSLISGAASSSTTGWQIPGNQLGPTGALRFVLSGDFLNNTGSGKNVTLKVNFGGTTMVGTLNAPGSGATRFPILLYGLLLNANDTGSQILTMYWPAYGGSPAAGSVAGVISPSTNLAVASGSASIDTTLPQYFDITVLLSASSSSLSFRRHLVLAEYL